MDHCGFVDSSASLVEPLRSDREVERNNYHFHEVEFSTKSLHLYVVSNFLA